MKGPYLASMERRMVAFAIDAVLLTFLAIPMALAMGPLAFGQELAVACALVGFVAYHAMGLVNRDVGLGRVVAAISVVSLKAGPDLSMLQCVARPIVRLLWLLSGAVPAIVFRAPMFLAAPLVIDLALLTFHPLRQTVADIACRTVVVILPPLQPHRAPAGPMFSAQDAEFGPRPGRKDGA